MREIVFPPGMSNVQAGRVGAEVERALQGNISQPTLAPRHVLNKKRRETKCRLRLI